MSTASDLVSMLLSAEDELASFSDNTQKHCHAFVYFGRLVAYVSLSFLNELFGVA